MDRTEDKEESSGKENCSEAQAMAARNELLKYRASLEDLVRERTVELSRLNEELQKEIVERKRAETQLEQRNELLTTLLDVSNLVSSTLELRPLLEAILDRLKPIINYTGAKVFIVEDDHLKIFAHRSSLAKELESRYMFSIKDSLVSQEIVYQRKIVMIDDVLGNSPMAESFRKTAGNHMTNTLGFIRSWIGIPLMVRDKVIGGLTLDHTQPGYYQQHHAELGMAFANQVAIEFENARLYNETLQRADELKTMFSVHQAITSRLEWGAVLKLIADEARRLINTGRTAVFLVDGDELVLSVFSGKNSLKFLGYRLPIHQSLMGRSLITGEPIIINNVQENLAAYQDLAVKADVKSFLSVPLIAGSRHIGTITVVDKLSGDFNPNDMRILTMLASTAVIGLENARMYQEERRRHMEDEQRRRVAEGLRDILAILNSNRPLPEILEFIIGQAGRLMGTDTGALYRLQKDKDILTIEAATGLSGEYISEMQIPLGSGAVGRAVSERKPLGFNNINTIFPEIMINDQRIGKHLQWLVDNYKGMLAIPLFCKDETYGGIVLYYRETREFSKDEIDLAMTFADQVSMAIDNARLRAQAEEIAVAAERSRLARDLHDAVTQTLFSASLIAEVLPKIWERNPGEVHKRLDELRQLTRGALAEMRTLLLELRPTTLLESNLRDLLNQLTEAVMGRGRIPITLAVQGQPIIPCDVKIAFYRIAQEALNNIMKHSGATHVDVVLTAGKGEHGAGTVELRIQDNGRGFDIKRILPENFGLSIMHERAEAIGAEFNIESRPGEGTVVYVKWDQSKEGDGIG